MDSMPASMPAACSATRQAPSRGLPVPPASPARAAASSAAARPATTISSAPVVLSGEIDFQGSTFAAGVNGGGAFGPFSTTERMPWFSTMRARVGYPVGTVMPYLTGGAVWGQRSIDGPISASANYWTWTAGGGIEGFITERWSMKAEYLYMGTPSTSLLPGSNETASNNLVRVGVNYHF